VAISVEYPCILCPAEGFPLELGIGTGGQKIRMMGLLGGPKSLTIFLAMCIQCINMTDRETDGHRTTAKTALMHRVARYVHV